MWLPILMALPLGTGSTPDGVRFGWLGEAPTAPKPTVFFFGGTVDSLTEPHYQPAIDTLGPGVLCVTIDMPERGSLAGWREQLDGGQPLVSDLTRRGTAVLNHLIERRWTDPSKVAVFGTSRGGLMAYHFAAAEPRVRHIAAFAPVTDLLILAEFRDMKQPQRARAIAAARVADSIAGVGHWMTIGTTDDRVGTASAIDFAQRLMEAARAAGLVPRIDLQVSPSDGHRVPEGSYGAAARWLAKQWR